MKAFYEYENKYVRLYLIYPLIVVIGSIGIPFVFAYEVCKQIGNTIFCKEMCKRLFSKELYKLYRDGVE